MNMTDWTVSKQDSTARHVNGLEVEIQGSSVINIVKMPGRLKTSELPNLLREAVKAYQAASIPQLPRSENKPKRPVLSLKK